MSGGSKRNTPVALGKTKTPSIVNNKTQSQCKPATVTAAISSRQHVGKNDANESIGSQKSGDLSLLVESFATSSNEALDEKYQTISINPNNYHYNTNTNNNCEIGGNKLETINESLSEAMQTQVKKLNEKLRLKADANQQQQQQQQQRHQQYQHHHQSHHSNRASNQATNQVTSSRNQYNSNTFNCRNVTTKCGQLATRNNLAAVKSPNVKARKTDPKTSSSACAPKDPPNTIVFSAASSSSSSNKNTNKNESPKTTPAIRIKINNDDTIDTSSLAQPSVSRTGVADADADHTPVHENLNEDSSPTSSQKTIPTTTAAAATITASVIGPSSSSSNPSRHQFAAQRQISLELNRLLSAASKLNKMPDASVFFDSSSQQQENNSNNNLSQLGMRIGSSISNISMSNNNNNNVGQPTQPIISAMFEDYPQPFAIKPIVSSHGTVSRKNKFYKKVGRAFGSSKQTTASQNKHGKTTKTTKSAAAAATAAANAGKKKTVHRLILVQPNEEADFEKPTTESGAGDESGVVVEKSNGDDNDNVDANVETAGALSLSAEKLHFEEDYENEEFENDDDDDEGEGDSDANEVDDDDNDDEDVVVQLNKQPDESNEEEEASTSKDFFTSFEHKIQRIYEKFDALLNQQEASMLDKSVTSENMARLNEQRAQFGEEMTRELHDTVNMRQLSAHPDMAKRLDHLFGIIEAKGGSGGGVASRDNQHEQASNEPIVGKATATALRQSFATSKSNNSKYVSFVGAPGAGGVNSLRSNADIRDVYNHVNSLAHKPSIHSVNKQRIHSDENDNDEEENPSLTIGLNQLMSTNNFNKAKWNKVNVKVVFRPILFLYNFGDLYVTFSCRLTAWIV